MPCEQRISHNIREVYGRKQASVPANALKTATREQIGNNIGSCFVRCLQVKDCVVSEWSSWSLPLAFGVVERNRRIIQEGECCPDELLQQVNITSYLSEYSNEPHGQSSQCCRVQCTRVSVVLNGVLCKIVV